MVKVTFEYKDNASRKRDDEWNLQSCICDSVAECIEIYGLNEQDVEYKIISIEEV